MSTNNRTKKQGTDQQVLEGVNKDLTTMTSLPLGGTTYTPTSLAARIQSRIDQANAVMTAKAAWQHAITTYEATDTQVQVIIHDLKQLVIGAFGATSPKLADFGWSPRKITVLTPEEKAAAVAKRAATRKARGTKGPKAKLAITGATAAAAATATPPASNGAATPAVVAGAPAPAPAAAPPATPEPAATAKF